MKRKKLEEKGLPLHAVSFSKPWFPNFGRRFGMNATWIKNFALSAVACSLAAGTAAMAGPIGVTVDFSCADGQGIKAAGGNICTPNGPVGATAISSWSQGFAPGGAVDIAVSGTNKGNPEKVYYNPNQGDPKPSLSPGGAGTYTYNVTTPGDYLFSFEGVQIGEAVPAGGRREFSYTITGWYGDTEEFTESGVLCPTVGSCTPTVDFNWAGTANTDLLTDLVITTTDPYGATYVDNLEVDEVPAPEPGSLFLLGTGLLGLAFVVFRKSRTASFSLHS
jgi:hypothetical protein